MASIDLESLFTNVSLDKTIEICFADYLNLVKLDLSRCFRSSKITSFRDAFVN